MDFQCDTYGRPKSCHHDKPGELWLNFAVGNSFFAIVLLLACGLAYMLGFQVLAEPLLAIGIFFATFGFPMAVKAWFDACRTLQDEPQQDLDRLADLLSSADRQGLMLPPLGVSDPRSMTNSDLKKWVQEVNDMLSLDHRDRLNATFQKHGQAAESQVIS